MEIPSWFEFLKKSPLDLDLFNRESGARTEHYLLALPFLMVEHQSVLAKLRNCQISYSLLLLFGPSFWVLCFSPLLLNRYPSLSSSLFEDKRRKMYETHV